MGAFVDFLEDTFGIPPALTMLALFLVVFVVTGSVVTGENMSTLDVLGLVVLASPVWLPIALLFALGHLWMVHRQVGEILKTEYSLLEVKLPPEITRSPLAMETVLNVMYHTGEPADFIEKYWQGKSRPQFSLEIASFEGDLHFYVRTRTKLRDMTMAQIYSQYPAVEIVEVEDYTARIQYDEQTMDLFAVEQKLEKPNPYPIKTYIEFGLDKEQEEEYQIDPINSIIEFMGSMGKGEYLFLQIIIRSHEAEKRVRGVGKVDWQHEAQQEVDKLLKRDPKTKGSAERTEAGFAVLPSFTDEERRVADAMLRNVAKKPFDTGIRVLYFGYKDNFRPNQRSGLPTMFRTFQSHALNNFKPQFRTMFNWKIQNPFGIRSRMRKREAFQAYRWRSYFLPPHRRPYFVLSSEELATIYHFPGRATLTPTLRREPSRKAEAPANLPK